MPQLEMTHATTAHFIRQTTAEVLSTMLDIQVTAGEPYMEDVLVDPYCGVVAHIGLAGAWVGTGITRCDELTACDLYSRMLMMPASGINREVLDAFGEIANMIVGNLKTALESVMGQMGMSIPTVLHGSNFLSTCLYGEGLVVPFTWESGRLEVKVCLMPEE